MIDTNEYIINDSGATGTSATGTSDANTNAAGTGLGATTSGTEENIKTDATGAAAAAEEERIRLENEKSAAAAAAAGAASTTAAASATGSGTTTAAAAAPSAKSARNVNNIKYAIIEIKDETISVTNDAAGLNTEKTPRQYITEGANCKFALQISKIDCTTSNGMCIEFENSNYLLNLEIIVPKETDFSEKLIDEAFLVPAATTTAASASTASTGASGASTASTDASTASTGASTASTDASTNASTTTDAPTTTATSTNASTTTDAPTTTATSTNASTTTDAPTTSATTVRIDIITQLQDMELLDFYFKSDIDKAILTKESTEEDIQKLIDEIFKKIDKTTTKTEVTNEAHGNFGLPNIGKVCYISSLIHLLKDIKTYKPVENDSNPINSLTAKLFKYIETDNKGEYEANYNALVTALGKNPTEEGDPNDVLGKYELGNTVTIENVVPQDGKTTQNVFTEKKNALTTDYAIITINRNVNDQPNWETFDTTPPANYELAGKILNPPSHFVYINYDDQNKPIVYDDSRAEEFKDSSEKEGEKLFAPGIENYDSLLTEYKKISQTIFEQVGKTVEILIEEYQAAEQKFLEKNQLYKSTNYDEQRFKMQDKIVTMVLYRKKEAVSGGSRKNRRQKSKKTKRNYYTYKK